MQKLHFIDDNIEEFLSDIGRADDYSPSGSINKFFSLQQTMKEKVREKDIVTKDIFSEEDKSFMVPLYDVHVGAKTCFKDLFLKTIEFIDKTPNCYTVLGGDLLESATRQSVGLGIFDEEMHLTDQIRFATKELEVLANKGKILCAITGNHEMRPAYLNGWNPMEEIAHSLDIPYVGYQGFILLRVNGIDYKIFMHHGAGGGRTKGAKVNSAMRLNQIAIADLYISGHLHESFSVSDVIFEIENNELVQKKRVYVAAGSFLQYFGGYPEMQMLAPSLPGTLLLEFSGSRKSINVHT